jgi:polysaccharide export outer membrane protein
MRRFLLILALLVAGCHEGSELKYPTEVDLSKWNPNKLPLGPGDKISMTVFYGSHTINATYTLDESGVIAVQYIGAVHAADHTLAEVAEEVKTRLADGYLLDPVVSFNLVELNSLQLSVSGMVGKNGPIKFSPGLTITDAIAQAGGFTPLARKNMVKVTRTSGGTKQTYKIPVEMIGEGERPNFPMLPGDEVFVPERPW